MNREFINDLTAWKSAKFRKPLIVRGARQVGKTFIINEFGNKMFAKYLRVDFERDPEVHKIFSGSLSPENIISQIEVFSGKRIIPGETLLFLDEIQSCPSALKSLRYFFEEMPHLHVIAAGSLLEFVLNETPFPVGSVDFAWLRPFSFREFLRVSGNEPAAEYLPGADATAPVPPAVHEKLLVLLRTYCMVGGMPEAIARFISTGSLLEVTGVHDALIRSYLADVNKYRGRIGVDGIDDVLKRIATGVGTQVKYTAIAPEWTILRTRGVLRLIEQTLLIHRITASEASGLPLATGTHDKVFKFLMSDVGLLQRFSGLDPAAPIREQDLLSVYRGAMAEQFVGQELLCSRIHPEERLHYWVRQKKSATAEVDYLIVRNGRIIPVEVKSGAAGRLKSLSVYLNEHPECDGGIVLSQENVRVDAVHRIRFLPLYACL